MKLHLVLVPKENLSKSRKVRTGETPRWVLLLQISALNSVWFNSSLLYLGVPLALSAVSMCAPSGLVASGCQCRAKSMDSSWLASV